MEEKDDKPGKPGKDGNLMAVINSSSGETSVLDLNERNVSVFKKPPMMKKQKKRKKYY